MSASLLRNRYLLFVLIAVLAIGGVAALFGLPRLEDPRLTNRNPMVLTFLPGADPEQVEALVTEPIERRMREVDAIKRIESTSSLGVSFVVIELADFVVDPDPILAQLRSKLDLVEAELPQTASRPQLDEERGATAYGMIVSLRWSASEQPDMGILSRYADELADRLRNVQGTELVRLHGSVDEQVLVQPDRAALAARGLDPQQLARALAASDARLPVGRLERSGQSQLLQVEGAFDTLDRVRSVRVTSAGGSTTQVADVATVVRGFQEPPVAIATRNGTRTIYLGVRMQPDKLADQWSASVADEVASFGSEVNGNAELEVVFDQSRYTNARLVDLVTNLGIGALLIWLVVALIMGWRIGTLVAVSLPLSACAILIGFQLLGLPLHQISVFGLLVAMGLLIDNAIVVSDDVWSLRRDGMSPVDAVAKASRHLRVPLFVSTLTTALSFAPILLLQGNVGEFVGTIASAVILSVAVSLILSLTVVAALAGLVPLPKLAVRSQSPRSWWAKAFSPGRIALLAVLPPVLGFGLVPTLENQFFPAADRNQFQIELHAHGTTSVRGTQELVERVDAFVRRDERTKSTMWVAGQSIPSVYYNQIMVRDDAPAYAQGVVVAQDAAAAKELLLYCERELAAVVPEAMVIVRPFAQGPPVAAPVNLRLVGDDLETLFAVGDEVRAVMAGADGVLATMASIGHALPSASISYDEAALRAVGLSSAQASNQVRASLEGQRGGLVLEGTRRIPVVVRDAPATRETAGQLDGLELLTPAAERIPLAALADVGVASRVASISRRNGERVNNLYGYVDAEALPIEVLDDVMTRLATADVQVPGGYRLELGGDAEESDQAAVQLLRYIPLLMTIVVATLILAFRSMLLAGLLGVVAMFAAGYGLLALWLSGYPLGFNPLIGLAGLIGITFNDSIVVLAAIRADRDARSGREDAIERVVNGCKRHVWATTLTTAVGFLPLLLSGGDFWPPLCVVIAGGVLGATPLALGFVPWAYRRLVRVAPSLGSQDQDVMEVVS